MRTTGLALLIGTLLLGGCASFSSTGAKDADAGLIGDYQPDPPLYSPGELNRESVYELLAAEVAGQRQQFDTALEFYLRQAEKTRDPRVAERATRIAQFMRDPEAVLKAAEIWAQVSPDNEEPDHIRANILISEQRFDEALPVLESILDDGSTEAVLMLGSKSQQLSTESAKRYEALLARYSADEPERLDLLLTRALLKRRSGDIDGALALINQGLAIEPDQTDLLLQKIDIYRTRGEQDKALALTEKALRSSPEQDQLLIQKAQLLISSDPDTAVELIEELIRRKPEDAQMHYYFALLTLEHEQYAASRRILSEMAARDPHNSNLNFYLGVIDEATGHEDSALDRYLSVTSGPNLQQAYARAIALFEYSPQQADAVREIIDQGVQRHPELTNRLRLTHADWLQQQGKNEAALSVVSDALKSDPADVGLLYTHALLIEKQDPQQMLADLEKAIALDPDNGMIQNALGYSLTLYSNDYERAHDLISRALEQHPQDAAVLDSMGWVLLKLGREREALDFLRRAFDASGDPEVASHLIEALWQLGDKEQALDLLQQSLERAPDNDHLNEVAEKLGVSQ